MSAARWSFGVLVSGVAHGALLLGLARAVAPAPPPAPPAAEPAFEMVSYPVTQSRAEERPGAGEVLPDAAVDGVRAGGAAIPQSRARPTPPVSAPLVPVAPDAGRAATLAAVDPAGGRLDAAEPGARPLGPAAPEADRIPPVAAEAGAVAPEPPAGEVAEPVALGTAPVVAQAVVGGRIGAAAPDAAAVVPRAPDTARATGVAPASGRVAPEPPAGEVAEPVVPGTAPVVAQAAVGGRIGAAAPDAAAVVPRAPDTARATGVAPASGRVAPEPPAGEVAEPVALGTAPVVAQAAVGGQVAAADPATTAIAARERQEADRLDPVAAVPGVAGAQALSAGRLAATPAVGAVLRLARATGVSTTLSAPAPPDRVISAVAVAPVYGVAAPPAAQGPVLAALVAPTAAPLTVVPEAPRAESRPAEGQATVPLDASGGATDPAEPASVAVTDRPVAAQTVGAGDPGGTAVAPQGVAAQAARLAAAAPAGERQSAALAWSGGAGEAVDPVSLAAIQSFAQAGDPDPGAGPPVRDRIGAVLAAVPCARLQTEFDPETGALALRGHVPEEALRAPVLTALTQEIGLSIPLNDQLLILPRPVCGVLAGIESVGLRQSDDQSDDPRVIGQTPQAGVQRFAEGERLRFTLIGPDYPAFYYVDYFDAAGNVIHLQPNEMVALREVAPKGEAPVGGGDGGLKLYAAPPFGQEILAAFAASAPLYPGTRPIMEAAAPYLEFLRARVSDAREADADFRGEWFYIFVETGP